MGINAYKKSLLLGKDELDSLDFYGKQYIDKCMEIRKLASNGKIKMDTLKSSHILKAIKASGMQTEEFIVNCLCNIQPYVLRSSGKYLLAYTGYNGYIRLSIERELGELGGLGDYIKVHGILDSKNTDFSDKPCAVFISDILTISNTPKLSNRRYKIRYSVHRLLNTFDMVSVTHTCTNTLVALVNHKDIDNAINSQLENSLRKNISLAPEDSIMQSLYLSGQGEIEILATLIDMYDMNYINIKFKMILVQFCEHIISQTPEVKREAIRIQLESRYKSIVNYSNELYNLVLDILNKKG